MPTGLGFGFALPLVSRSVAASAAEASSLAPGYYYNDTSLTTDPVNIDSGTWIASVSQVTSSLSRFNDVGVNDHTTYHEGATGAVSYMKGLYIYEEAVTIEGYTCSIWREVPAVQVWYSTNGSTWILWSSPSPLADFTHAWVDISEDPADVTARYVQIIATDTATEDPPSRVRIGDWRIQSI